MGAEPKAGYTYDKNGNLTSDGVLSYYYDALNRRTIKSVFNDGLTGDIPDGDTTYYYWQPQLVEEWGESYPTKQYVWSSISMSASS